MTGGLKTAVRKPVLCLLSRLVLQLPTSLGLRRRRTKRCPSTRNEEVWLHYVVAVPSAALSQETTPAVFASLAFVRPKESDII